MGVGRGGVLYHSQTRSGPESGELVSDRLSEADRVGSSALASRNAVSRSNDLHTIRCRWLVSRRRVFVASVEATETQTHTHVYTDTH